MNIIEAVKLIKTGVEVARKERRNHYEIYGFEKGWQKFFFEDDILADDWEVVDG